MQLNREPKVCRISLYYIMKTTVLKSGSPFEVCVKITLDQVFRYSRVE